MRNSAASHSALTSAEEKTAPPNTGFFKLTKDLYQFLGKRVFKQFTLSITVGLTAWAVELLVALSLQGVLIAMGIVKSVAKPPLAFLGDGMLAAIGTFAFLLIFKAVVTWVHVQFNHRMSTTVRLSEQRRVFDWFFSRGDVGVARLEYFLQNQLTNIGNFVWAIQSFVLQSMVCLFLIAYLVHMIPLFTFVICGILALVAMAMRSHNLKVRKMGTVLNLDQERISRLRQMNVKNILFLKVTGTEETKKDELMQGYQVLSKNSLRFYRIDGIKTVLSQMAAAIIVVVIALLGNAIKISTPATIISYLYLLNRLLQTAVLATTNITEINRNRPSFDEYMNWWNNNLAEKKSVGSPIKAITAMPLNVGKSFQPGPIGWRLKGIEFRYGVTGKLIFSDFSLDVPPGSALVINGPSGRGKSTLLNLLLGQIAPTAGEVQIHLAGQFYQMDQVKKIVLKSLGYVGPESYLIEGTVLENLTFGLETINFSAMEIETALRDAGCDFVFRFPQGIQHRITDQGEGLSAGQKQRLCLARALLKKPRALILDEATANLDHETERSLVESLMKLRGQVTLIAVTHRPEVLKLALQELHL